MEFVAPTFNLILILPVLLIMVWAMLLMVIDLVLPQDKKKWIAWLTLVGIALAFVQTIVICFY